MRPCKTIYDKVLDHPRIAGLITSIPFLPITINTLDTITTNPPEKTLENLMLATVKIASPFITYKITKLLVQYLAVKRAIRKKPENTRTKKEDKQLIKNLEERINQETPPQLQLGEMQEINIPLTTAIKKYFHKDPEKLEEIAQQTESPAISIEAGIYYLGKEDDKALVCFRNATDWLKGKTPKPTRKTRLNLEIIEFLLAYLRKKHPRYIEYYLMTAAIQSITRPQQAYYYSKLGTLVAQELNLPYKKEIYVYHALLASTQNRTDQQQAWQDAIKELQKDPIWERIGETRTIVRVIKNNEFFARTLIFKEGIKEKLEREIQNSKTLEQLIPEITTPEPICLSEENGKYTYVMRYVEGPTLHDQLQKGNKKDMPRVISALAKIHARYPAENLQKIDLQKTIYDKLQNPDLSIPEDLANTIIQNYSPVTSAITYNALWVWNKDAHPENWIINKKIGVIDCETEQAIPSTLDLANLLEYGDHFTTQEKKTHIIQYAQELQKENKNFNMATAMEAYYNSVIHRMIALTSAWSSPERTRMKTHRKQAIQRAIDSIQNIQQETNTYYRQHEQQYTSLNNALEQLKTTL